MAAEKAKIHKEGFKPAPAGGSPGIAEPAPPNKGLVNLGEKLARELPDCVECGKPLAPGQNWVCVQHQRCG